MHAVGEDVIEEVPAHHSLAQEAAEVIGEDGENGVDLPLRISDSNSLGSAPVLDADFFKAGESYGGWRTWARAVRLDRSGSRPCP